MKKKAIEPKSVSFETFREMDSFDIGNIRQVKPSCFNSKVSFRKYRITVELIDEPLDVLQVRVIKLWRECDNFHHYHALRAAGVSVGLTLDEGFGAERRKDDQPHRAEGGR